MRNNPLYRHASWHERILSSFPVQLLLGFFFIAAFPTIWTWGWDYWSHLVDIQINTLLIIALSLITVTLTLRRILRYPGEQGAAYIFPTILVVSGTAMACVLLLRLPYSNFVLIQSFVLAVVWFTAGHFFVRNLRTINLALVPFGKATKLKSKDKVNLIRLEHPVLPEEHMDGIVADLHSNDITPDWERFLAHCTLNHIPVFHIKQVKESLTGRVRINHLAENEFGTLLPSPFYSYLKRMVDIITVLLLIPIALPITLFAGLLIKQESKGGFIFTQQRMGYRGKPFTLYKIRTMYTDIKGKGVTSNGDDPRITRLGKILRKYRIDELPQLWNVLRGEMSLIGPRPESMELTKEYEEKVPFFSYRHVVRPGISGWAQVMQGYTDSTETMQKKLEYDFYYIKHFSLWLDMLIVYKTIRTVLTGFGSR